MSNNNEEYYDLHLPVFKQGDDLSYHLEKSQGNHAQAFLNLAEQYEAAASICKRVASVVAEAKNPVSVEACTHSISITAAKEDFLGLVQDGVVLVCDWDQEDGDDFEEGDFGEEGLDEDSSFEDQ